jgi:hypothetical protein
MVEPGLDLQRPRDLGALLSDAFALYRRWFGVFAIIALAVVVPVELVVEGIGLGQLTSSYDATPSREANAVSAVLLFFVITPLLTAMNARAVMDVGEGRVPDARRAIQAGLDAFAPLLAVLVLVFLGVLCGILLLVLPGIYLAVRWFVAPQTVVVEGKHGPEALQRSAELVRGHWWRVLGVVIVLNVVAGVMGLVIQAPFAAIANGADSGAIALVGTILGNAVTLSFVALAGTLLFFDLRTRAAGWEVPVVGSTPVLREDPTLERPEALPGGFTPPRPDDE